MSVPKLQDIHGRQIFRTREITAAMNAIKAAPATLKNMGLFRSIGIKGTSFELHYKQGRIILIPSAKRGEAGSTPGRSRSGAVQMSTIHQPLTDTIEADEILQAVMFGTVNNPEALENLIKEHLEERRISHEATIEYGRNGALFGKIMDADGTSVLEDLYDKFGVSDTPIKIDMASADLGVSYLNPLRKSKKALKDAGMSGRGFKVLMGSDYTDAMLKNADFKEAFKLYNQSQQAREVNTSGINFAGMVFEEYDASVGNVEFIQPNQAKLVPLGVRDLFLTHFAPAPMVSAVGEKGRPFYASTKLLDHEVGVEIKTSTDQISVCTNLEACPTLQIK